MKVSFTLDLNEEQVKSIIDLLVCQEDSEADAEQTAYCIRDFVDGLVDWAVSEKCGKASIDEIWQNYVDWDYVSLPGAAKSKKVLIANLKRYLGNRMTKTGNLYQFLPID